MFKLCLRSMVLCAALSPALLAAAPSPAAFDRPLAFEPNLGQAPGQFSWTARGQGYQLFLTSSGLSITKRVTPKLKAVRISLSRLMGWV